MEFVTEWSRYGGGQPPPRQPLGLLPREFTEYQGRHDAGRHRVPTRRARLPRAFSSSFVLPTAAAAALVVTATGATVAKPAPPPSTSRRHADRDRAHRAGRRRGDGHRPRRAPAGRVASRRLPCKGRIERPPRATAHRQAQGGGAARRRRPSARASAGSARSAPGTSPLASAGAGARPTTASTSGPHGHTALRDVKGRGHPLVQRVPASATRSRSATGTAPCPGWPHSRRDRPDRRQSCPATVGLAATRALDRPARAPRDPPAVATPARPLPVAQAEGPGLPALGATTAPSRPVQHRPQSLTRGA